MQYMRGTFTLARAEDAMFHLTDCSFADWLLQNIPASFVLPGSALRCPSSFPSEPSFMGALPLYTAIFCAEDRKMLSTSI